jgi:hypothetical protein
MVWNGLTGFAGWQALAPSLDDNLRGTSAYFLGHRYSRMNREGEASEFWKAALTRASPGSLLERLSRAELKRTQHERGEPNNGTEGADPNR